MEALLDAAKSLPAVKQRMVAAIVGGLVADAASQPLMWIYDPAVMKQSISANPDTPEFNPVPGNPFYRLPVGSATHYGDHGYVALKSLHKCKGYNEADYMEQYLAMFGPGSLYDKAYKEKTGYPIMGPYQESTDRRFAELHAKGQTARDIDDTNQDPNCIDVMIPVAAFNAGKPDIVDSVVKIVTLVQSNKMVMEYVTLATKLLEHYILHGNDDNVNKVMDAVKSSDNLSVAVKGVQDVTDNKNLSVAETTSKFGVACALPGSFQSAFRALLDDTSYTGAVREVIKAGGANGARVCFVGACLGAKYGLDSIPVDWISKTTCGEEILSMAVDLAKA